MVPYGTHYIYDNHYFRGDEMCNGVLLASSPRDPILEPDELRKGCTSRFKVLHLIGYESDEVSAVTAHPSTNRADKVYSFLKCSESSGPLLHLRSTVGKAFSLPTCNYSTR